jgi:hypothetical protein
MPTATYFARIYLTRAGYLLNRSQMSRFDHSTAAEEEKHELQTSKP